MIEKYSPQDIAAALQKVGAKVYQPTDEQSAIISIASNPLEPAVVIAGAGSGKTALDAVNIHLMNYSLGEDVLIGNPAHYIGNLEGLYGPPSSRNAPQGIMKPATDKIMSIYAIKLDDYYNAGKNWSGGWQ